MKRLAVSLMVAFVVALAPVGHSSANAASGRIEAKSIGMNAPIVKVGVKNGSLAIRSNVHAVYTWNRGDPPCDSNGTTVYVGHAWRAGNGVADRWAKLTRGRIISVGGCRFKVTKREYWRDDRKVNRLYRVDGPPRIVLIGCKADDYSKQTMVFARRIR